MIVPTKFGHIMFDETPLGLQASSWMFSTRRKAIVVAVHYNSLPERLILSAIACDRIL